MTLTILTPDEMGRADRRAIEQGPLDGVALMQNAGAAVAAAVLERFPQAARVDVLCGPGNNGGDGYVAATILAGSGVGVLLWAEGVPRAGSDAAAVATVCPVERRDLAEFEPQEGTIVIDALYGAGLARPLEGSARAAVEKLVASGLPVVAVDLPSGLSGESGEVLGIACRATVTVTFVRKKPGHLLYPGRVLCGELLVSEIGISDTVVEEIGSLFFENQPPLWLAQLPRPAEDTYKYSRGHVGVFSGGVGSTGAARLAAMAAARIGAGAVTLLSPPAALVVNAAHLTSIILRRIDGSQGAATFMEERRPAAVVAGPGLGVTDETAELIRSTIERPEFAPRALVLDADALTVIARDTGEWFRAFGSKGAPATILTPHEGEFGRLFPDLRPDAGLSKLAKARAAAERAHAVVVYKGPDTVIAAPDGRTAINTNGTPLLATAGSGDVLSGIVAGLAAQGMPPFEAACAGVWIHAEAAREFGPGLIAEDLPGMLPQVLRSVMEWGNSSVDI